MTYMPDAWDFVKDTQERPANTITTFILFCEDSVSEPYYFQRLESEMGRKVKVNIVPGQKQAHANVSSTIDYCFKNGLMDFQDGEYKLKPGITENIWCVYDRDLENEDLTKIKPVHDISFDTSIQAAERAGLKVAWSNDEFELWILLHFELPPTGMRWHRRTIYDRLTTILRALPNQSEDMVVKVHHPQFNYKDTMKREKNFVPYILPLLFSRLEQAIEHAKALEAVYPPETVYHQRNPCTMVHHLVIALQEATN